MECDLPDRKVRMSRLRSHFRRGKPMGRIVKSPDVRQNEILDAAQQLFYTKGYENTAVQDIINEIGIAKGTFYYHFNSKEDLLDALATRLLEQSLSLIIPIIEDENVPALEKLHRFFNESSNFKLENESLVRTLMSVWYQDNNAIMREKMKTTSFNGVTPLLTQIIHQGVAEGVFQTSYPDEIGRVVMQTSYELSDTFVKLILRLNDETSTWEDVRRKVMVYDEAIASLLGAEPGSIHLVDIDQYRHWFEET
jgi:AcrR family transcriptional regulator